MIFNEFKQNNSIIKRLQKNISKGKIFHAYIFEASKKLDKLRFALGFVEEIFCQNLKPDERELCKTNLENGNHPDVIIISHPDKAIKDEEIFAIQGKLNTAPILASHKVVIIDGADSATVRAQNRILKTLEEPAVNCIIIFLSENSEYLLQTIRSRCIVLSLNPELKEFSEEELQIKNVARGLIISLKNKEPFYRLIKNYEKHFSSKEDIPVILSEMEVLLSEDLLVSALKGQSDTLVTAINLISEAIQDIKQGANPSYSIKKILIQLEDIL